MDSRSFLPLPDDGVLAANAPTPFEALRRIHWLDAVPLATLKELAGHAVLHQVPAGSMLFDQGETPAFAQFQIGGTVEMFAEGRSAETLVELTEPVDLILPAAALSRQPYLLRARVLREARLLLIHVDAFRQLVGADHALCLAVLACQAAQFRRQVMRLKNVLLRSAEERVGCYLLNLAEAAPLGAEVRLPLEKRLIASQLGMTRETFSRSLALVARHGLRVDDDLVRVDDVAAARTRFPLDPLIDGREAINPIPLQT